MNAAQLGPGRDLEAVARHAKTIRLPVFVGVVVPERHRRWVLHNLDDALADVVGRLGPRLTAIASASADVRSSAASRRGDRDQRA